MADPPGVPDPNPVGLHGCLSSMLARLERSVGFAEGVVMSFAATIKRSPADALAACRNEQLDADFGKFRELATGGSRVIVASREVDPRTRSSPRWLEILDARGHGHELRAALVDR